MAKQKNTRSLKVHGQSGYNYSSTPAIMLKGKWLESLGFKIGDFISITCEDGRLVITPDAERAKIKAAEEEFMAREMKALHKRYEIEKANIRAQMVAEPGVRW